MDFSDLCFIFTLAQKNCYHIWGSLHTPTISCTLHRINWMLNNRYTFPFAPLLLLLPLLQLPISTFAQDTSLLQRRIDLVCENCTCTDAILNVYRQTGINVTYSNSTFANCPRVSITFKDETIGNILKKIISDCGEFDIVAQDNQIIIKSLARKINLSGYIIDEVSKEKLIGASIQFRQDGRLLRAISNMQGFYMQQLRTGQIDLTVTYPGYDTVRQRIKAIGDISRVISMRACSKHLTGIDIVAALPSSMNSHKDGSIQIVPNQMHYDLTSIIGQPDVFRSANTVPGIQSGIEGMNGMHVRGGNSDQNLILYDGVPVYNANHAAGLVSIFNSDIIKNAKLWKGDFPAKYSGRSASVMDIRTRDGNVEKWGGNFSLTPLMVGGHLEGPLLRDKLSVLASFRHSVINPWLRTMVGRPISVLSAQFNKGLTYETEDFALKATYKASKRDEIALSFYWGLDLAVAPIKKTTNVAGSGTFFDDYRFENRWGNQLASFRWHRAWKGNLFSNTTLSASQFKYKNEYLLNSEFIDLQGKPLQPQKYKKLFFTQINDQTLRTDWEYSPKPRLQVFFGGVATSHAFSPGIFTYNLLFPGQANVLIDSLEKALLRNNKRNATELEAYTSIETTFRKFRLEAGLNGSVFRSENARYSALLPRLKLVHGDKEYGFKKWISHNYMAQYLHQAGSFNIGLPFEIWVPSTQRIKPERAVQTSIGASWNNKDWSVVSELYYKDMESVVTLLSIGGNLIHAGADDAGGWEERMAVGEAHTQGWELLIERKSGMHRGFISYTLSHADRHFDEINSGKAFPYQFDRPHNLKTNYTVYFKNNMNITATWTLLSGTPITLTGVKYRLQIDDPNYVVREQVNIGEVNGARLPITHRLDLGINYHFFNIIHSRPIRHSLQLGIYNLYNQKNPFFMVADLESGQKNKVIYYTLFPILPTFRYAISF